VFDRKECKIDIVLCHERDGKVSIRIYCNDTYWGHALSAGELQFSSCLHSSIN